jgi:hypothetical protein
VNDNERSIAPRAPSVYDKAADGRSLLHKNPVVARPVNDDERSMALDTLDDDSSGLVVCDNPSLGMECKEKEDEEGSILRIDQGDAAADEVDDDEVRV